MKTWGISNVGAVRTQNQDTYRIDTPGADCVCAVVCDGMGGARAGDTASALAADAFIAAVRRAFAVDVPTDLGAVLRDGVLAANRAVYARANADPACHGMGTTLVAALVLPDAVHVINVGDSRAYYASEQGIERVTRDHSVVEELVQKGELTPEAARIHPQKNLITRVIGSEPSVAGDVYRLVPSGGYLLLCSDGLSGVLTDQELLFELVHGGHADTCCDRLLSVSLEKGAPDNVTAVLIAL